MKDEPVQVTGFEKLTSSTALVQPMRVLIETLVG
jgi:hypothetical protein